MNEWFKILYCRLPIVDYALYFNLNEFNPEFYIIAIKNKLQNRYVE